MTTVETARAWVARNPLRIWRKNTRTPLAIIAGTAHVGIAAVQNWEHGAAQPTDEHMQRVADLMGLTVSTLQSRWRAWLNQRSE